jgi:hypothetical protein
VCLDLGNARGRTCTANVTVSSTSSEGSKEGHVAYAFVSPLPSALHSSSERCGAYGDSNNTNGVKTCFGFVSHFVAVFTNSIIAEIAVLKRIPSVSSVTFFTHSLMAFSCSAVGSSSVILSASNSRYALAKNREHPSTPLVCQTFVSRNGPMNISSEINKESVSLVWENSRRDLGNTIRTQSQAIRAVLRHDVIRVDHVSS